ncbi:unnamed protein product [Paramecium pentaurelia]|uniref:Uncharacterized protein n=1 Tax=Paramecium pentaurelia TaxID=43138 RepID=A0A8S1TBU1_9CILI|nr:unnamed protein product [Paramecium pentaurelia]
MILEYALNEEDDYKRMTNITRGCQQLAQQLPFYSNFTNSNLIRQLFCCYPFQQEPVKLLLSIMMDRFQNVEFLNCFYKGLLEIALLQEQKAMLSSRSPGRGRKRLQIGQQGLAKNVIENLVISKQFAVSFLKPIFNMVQQLRQSLESRSGIFMTFIFNTRDEQVIKLVVDNFEECKSEIFGACTWVNRIDEQIVQFFYSNQIIRSQNIIQVDQDLVDEPQESSESSIEIDPNEEIQKWICQKNTPMVNEQLDYFRSFEYLDLIFKYIFDPCHFSAIHEWEHHYDDIQIKHNQNSRKLNQNKDIDKLLLLRSLKTIKILMHENNYPIITKIVPQFLFKLFHYIYDSLNDYEKNIDLNQIAFILDFLLQTNPRQSILMIVEFNLMFQLVSIIYNENIAMIVQKIISDEYDMGNYVFDHFWQYLDCTNWIQYFLSISLNLQVDTFRANKNNQSDKTVQIVGLLKQQINYDRLIHQQEINVDEKKLLTDYLGQLQAGKNYIQFYSMNQLNWHMNQNVKENITVSELLGKDIDNLMQFRTERQMYQSKVQMSIRDKLFVPQLSQQETKFIRGNSKRQIKETLQQRELTNKQIAQTIRQLPRLTIGNQELSKWINTGKNQINLSVALSPKKTPRSYQIKTEQSTDFSSFYEGFSSGRLKGLYPSPKISIQSSSFERKAKKHQSDMKLLPSCISILKQIIQNIFQNMMSLTSQNKKQAQRLKVEQDSILPSFLNQEMLTQLFRVYLYDINNQDKQISDTSCECGLIINEIYLNCKQHSELHQYKSLLKSCFYEIGDYICKIIVKLHDQDQPSKFKRHLLTSTLQEGLILFGEQQDTPKNIFSILNETVLHLLIIWFFDSDQTNTYQQTFVKLFTIIFSRAPQYLLGIILFKLGLISSLQNAYFNFFINSVKFTTGVESLFYYVSVMIYAIKRSLLTRKIESILSNLEPLSSWKQFKEVEIDNNSKFVQQIECILQEHDGKTPRQIIKKKTITIHSKNVMQSRRSQLQIQFQNKFSMQQTTNDIVNLMRVKDKLLYNKKSVHL